MKCVRGSGKLAAMRRARPAILVVLVAGTTLLLGWLGHRLAIGDGFAWPFDMAAGFSVAVLVLWPTAAPLGVLIGSVAAALIAPGMASDAPFTAMASGSLAAGAAWVSAVLGRRWLPYPGPIDAPPAISRLMLGVAPIGGLLGGLSQLLVALTLSHAAWDAALTRAITAGIAAMLGIAIVLPVLCALFGQPRVDWDSRRLAIIAPLLVALAVVGAAITHLSRLEVARHQDAFDREAQLVISAAAERINGHLSVLDATHAFVSAARHVDIERFSVFAQHWFPRFGGIAAIGLSTRVQANERATFEATLRNQSPLDFQILTRGPDGRLTPAEPAAEHFAITYIEPRRANLRAIGVDQLSIPQARDTIQRAIRLGGAAATRPFRLTQDLDDQLGVVVYRPFYRSGPDPTPTQRDPWYVAGMSFVALRPAHWLPSLESNATRRFDACLFDVTETPRVLLAGASSCEAQHADSRILSQRVFSVADRQWRMSVRPVQQATGHPADWAVWGMALSAMCSVALLVAFLLAVSGRTRRIEALISSRTSELEREIIERRSALLARTESETRLREMFDTAPVGISYTALDGTLQRINPRFAEITGRSAADVDGRKIGTLLDPEDRDEFTLGLLDLIGRGGGIFSREARCLRPDGSTVHVELLVSLHRSASGEPRQLVVAMQDISARLELVQARRAREVAEAASSAKTQFLSRISHELRTPLNALLGFAQLLRLDTAQPLGARQAENVRHIEQAGWHLLNMINDVLDLSRIEAGSVRIEWHDIDLQPVLEDCRRLLQAHFANHGVSLSVSVSPRARYVRGDPTRVRQVFTNLLDNAAKYSRPGGRVFVDTRRDETGSVVVSVRDEGLGMSRDQRTHLFEPFNRLGREHGTAGTGIGLVITRHLTEMMGGAISVDSIEGKGSLFMVTMVPAGQIADPIPDDAAAPAKAPVPAPEPGRSPAESVPAATVVYVEDNRLNAMLVQEMLLQHTRLRPEVFEDAEEALPEIARLQPAAVLMDLNLPGMDGLQALARLRMDPATARIPVVIVSADALSERIEQAHELGADGYLTKPLRVSELIDLLDTLIGRDAVGRHGEDVAPLTTDAAPTRPAGTPPR